MTHNVVVLGAGYSGLPAAKRLARQVYPGEVTVTLVTAFPDFVERPRLHQLATGQRVTRTSIASYLGDSGVRLVVGAATGIDHTRRTVTVASGAGRQEVGYDTLIYALGSNIDATAVPGIAANAYSLTGIDAALDLQPRLRALAGDAGRVVVCGGGLTGLETAAEVAERYPSLDVSLVTAGTPGGWLSAKGQRYLHDVVVDLGVTVHADTRVTEVEDGKLLFDRSALPFDLCLWAGGFRVPRLARDSGLAVNADGRALVDSTLRSLSHRDVYVIGDSAAIAGHWGSALAMGCRTGGFTGPYVADAVAARLTGRTPRPFSYRYFHECISLGRRRGLIQFLNADESPKSHVLTGRAAIGYKNTTLGSARMFFRWPGPYPAHRRHATA